MNILLIGSGSYIGVNVKQRLEECGHSVKEFDIKNQPISESIFFNVDSVIHLAAIVHQKNVKDYVTYKKVNVDLPYEVASIAKNNGVKHFVFLSSMAVYADKKTLSGSILNRNSKCICTGNSFYGKSKLEAEMRLQNLEDTSFSIAYIRPANVYGKNCRGTYMYSFDKIVRMIPIIPRVYEQTKQGLVYIDNLCELIRLVVEYKAKGIFPAQDEKTVSSMELMCEIAKARKIKRPTSKLLGLLILLIKNRWITKLYGGVVYDDEYAKTSLGNYNVCSFAEGIRRTFSE